MKEHRIYDHPWSVPWILNYGADWDAPWLWVCKIREAYKIWRAVGPQDCSWEELHGPIVLLKAVNTTEITRVHTYRWINIEFQVKNLILTSFKTQLATDTIHVRHRKEMNVQRENVNKTAVHTMKSQLNWRLYRGAICWELIWKKLQKHNFGIQRASD